MFRKLRISKMSKMLRMSKNKHVNVENQLNLLKSSVWMLKIKWVIHGATSISDGVFGIVLGWIGTWLTLDWNGLTSDWSRIGDWSQIGNRWAEDWRRTVIGWHRWVGRNELADVRIVIRWDTSVGPYSILIPCLLTEVASDWYDVVTMRANPVSIHFLLFPLIGARVW